MENVRMGSQYPSAKKFPLNALLQRGPNKPDQTEEVQIMTEYVRRKGTRDSVTVDAISADEAPNFAFRKFAIEPGGHMPRHTNLVEHEQYVLKGFAALEIEEDTFDVSEGDAVYIPEKVPHSYRAGAEGFEFICVVPNRRDKIEMVE
jgi:quercetin dioxygenase-like cupin family protein